MFALLQFAPSRCGSRPSPLRGLSILTLTSLLLSGCGSAEQGQEPSPNTSAQTVSEAPSTQTHTKMPDKPTQPKLKLIPSTKAAGSNSKATMVYTSSGAIQCQFNGHPPSKTAATLEAAGVKVLRSHCGQRTGLMITAMCGSGSTRINLHEIRREDATQAVEAGYRLVSELAHDKEIGYEIVKCDSNDR